MVTDKKTSKPKASRGGSAKRMPATLRSTSGAGFEFEDLISAWQLVKALSGEQAPGIGGVVTQLQAQVSTLGWHIDDLLLKAQVTTEPRRLAISAKGNLQVSAAGLPADFVTRAWEQWRDLQGGPLALTTRPGDNMLYALKAARDTLNHCSGMPSLMLVFTGSDRDQLRYMTKHTQPFFGSFITDFPVVVSR